VVRSLEAVAATRPRILIVGGGYAGVEAMAELEDLARFACRYYPRVRREDMRWVLVEAAPRILPEIGEGLGEYALENLRGRDIDVFLSTTLESAEGGVVTLSSGERFAADTLVWTAGVRPAPVVSRLGMPVDDRGRIEVDEFLRVKGVEGAWAAGDCAAVPDVITGGLAPPTAQHALREAKQLALNVAATVRGRSLAPFRYRSLGGLASLGLYKGVARIPGVRLRGFPAWFLHRSYHVLRVPTMNRKARIVADWTVALFFRRDVVQLGSLRTPRAPFEEAFQANERPGGAREG
jgi:NADH:quinone reductase (non-electrogenic)